MCRHWNLHTKLEMIPKAQTRKEKTEKLDYFEINNLPIKGHYQQSKKAHRMTENICKSYIQLGDKIQNI